MIEYYIAIILVAIGTYLTRFLPIRFSEKFRRLKSIDEYLTYSSIALISALLATSLVSLPVNPKNICVSITALVFVFLSYRKWKNLGISVVIGVSSHLLLSLVIKI